jgi:CubicO group peptidase (beta-lactamase class C family)
MQLAMMLPVYADDATASMDEIIKYETVNYNVPGIAVSIVKDGTVLYQVSQGMADLSQNVSMNASTTAIQTGSIGKVLTSMALLKLLSQQDIDLEASISDYLIDAYIPDNTLTFRDLLQHTTGIPSVRADTAEMTSPLERDPLKFSDYAADFMTQYRHRAVLTPGEDTIYSNVGSVLAGLLVEALSNTPFEQYVSEEILKPLGMTDSASFLMGNPNAAIDIAKGYNIFGGAQTEQSPYKSKLIASDDFVTTSADMTTLLQDMTRSMYARSDYRDMFTRQVSAYEGLLGRSLGFSIKQDEGVDLYLQDGGIPGETSRLFFIPELGVGVFIWYNSDATTLRDELTDEILSIYAQDAVHHTSAVLENFDGAEYKDLIGAYSPMNISTETIERVTKIIRQIRVSETAGGLVIDKATYKPVGNNTFYSEDDDNYARFIFDDSNKLEYLVIDNTYYQRVGLFESVFFEMLVLFLAALFNLIAVILLSVRWDSLRVNRIHSTPRTVLLLETLFSSATIGLILWIALRYNAWLVAFNAGSATLWVKITGIVAGILYIPSLIMLGRGENDFRWRGGTTFIFRMLLIFNALLLIWMWRYNFI